MAENIPRGTPARILILLALLLAGTAAGLWNDASRRDTLESVHWPTAAGLPAGTVPGDGLVSFAEKTWTLGPEEPRGRGDVRRPRHGTGGRARLFPRGRKAPGRCAAVFPPGGW